MNSPIRLGPKPPGVSVLGASPLEGEQSQLHRNKVPFVLSIKLPVVLEMEFVEMHIIFLSESMGWYDFVFMQGTGYQLLVTDLGR